MYELESTVFWIHVHTYAYGSQIDDYQIEIVFTNRCLDIGLANLLLPLSPITFEGLTTSFFQFDYDAGVATTSVMLGKNVTLPFGIYNVSDPDCSSIEY